jgi:hypothetical protein
MRSTTLGKFESNPSAISYLLLYGAIVFIEIQIGRADASVSTCGQLSDSSDFSSGQRSR